MFALLPHAEEVLQMDYGVLASVQRIESLSLCPAITKSIVIR